MDAENNTHTLLIRFVGTDQRVLELGAASGYITEVLKSRGCTVTAVEFDPEAVDELGKVADRAIIGNLNDPAVLDAAPGPFDVVLAGDVLEHLLDPLAVLRKCIGRLAPDGRVVISVPNVSHSSLALALVHGGWRYTETGLLDRTHIYFFTYDGLLGVLSDAGLIVTGIERIVAGPFDTEQELSSGDFDPGLVAQAFGRPEAMTYQFVVSAEIDHGDPAQQQRSAEVLAGGLEREAESRRAWLSEHGLADVSHPEVYRDVVTTLQGYLAVAERDRDDARAQVENVRLRLGVTAQQLDTALAAADARRVERANSEEQRQKLDDELAGLQEELRVARQELQAACVAEARATGQNSKLLAAVSPILETAALDRDYRGLAAVVERMIRREQEFQEVEAIRRTRSFRTIQQYHGAMDRLAPTGTRRRRVLLKFTRAGSA